MKKSIVLFTTLLMIMALMGVMMIFLKSTKNTKDNITQEFALIQTNNIMNNLTVYFNKVPFDEETIFYGSKMPFILNLNDSVLKFTIDSGHKYLNINLITKSMKNKDNEIYNNFLSFLYQYKLRNPEFFIDLLLDTMDKDENELNSGNGSEIVISDPTFRNGYIYNKKHFGSIIDYYFTKQNDEEIYNIPFDDIISFNSTSLDINFMSKELLSIIFYDADQYSLNQIAKHNNIYKSIEDLPFDETYLKTISKGRFGHQITAESTLIKVDVELKYKTQFSSKIRFFYNIKTKTLSDYEILDIKIY